MKYPINIDNAIIYQDKFVKKYFFEDELNTTTKTYFYYCKNEEIILDEIKQDFPNTKFHSKDLNYNFDLNIEDLLYIKDAYIYFLMFFVNDNINNRIIIGKAILKIKK